MFLDELFVSISVHLQRGQVCYMPRFPKWTELKPAPSTSF